MQRLLTLVPLLAGCGFDVHFEISMARGYGSLADDKGKPVDTVAVDRSFSSIDEAQAATIPFEITDGRGAHVFELHGYVRCDDDSASSLTVYLELAYAQTCGLGAPVGSGEDLIVCWNGSRCGNVTAVARAAIGVP